jgi:hypothetical protein
MWEQGTTPRKKGLPPVNGNMHEVGPNRTIAFRASDALLENGTIRYTRSDGGVYEVHFHARVLAPHKGSTKGNKKRIIRG